MKLLEEREAKDRERWITKSDRASLEIAEDRPPRVCSILFVIPTVCDLLGTTLGGIGLLYVSASVWQMLRGSVIVFSGVLSVIFLRRTLRLHHWLAMAVICAGLTLVGASDLLATAYTTTHPQQHPTGPSCPTSQSTPASVSASMTWLGIACILGGQLASAIQMVLEETFIKHRKYPALNVVGMEGSVGLCLMCLAVLPALYFFPPTSASPTWVASMFRDDSIDALVQLRNAPLLAAMMGAYVCSIAFYNFFGLSVTKNLTAVHRTLIDACRTIIVWVSELIIYYFLNPCYGEAWSTPWSFIELGGFGLLILGTLIYNGVVRLPFSVYDPPASLVPVDAISIKEEKPLLHPSEEEK
jgi:drug/metabolite transporter (DMT)-like permease